jgi:endonuclease/exonuclease/phosphatase family metal-dependent hydrolase
VSILTIGSFNLHNCSQSNPGKSLTSIARIIQAEEFDVVALQEIIDESSAAALCSVLGSQWKYEHQRPPVSTHKAKGYGFLWKARVLDPCGNQPFKIWPDPDHALTRPPLVGTFAYRGKHLALINIQMAADEMFSLTKQSEYRHLCDEVFPTVDRTRRIEHPASHTILLGDYNLKWIHMAQLHSMFNIPLKPDQDQPTTLTDPRDGSDPKYYLSLDHFTYDPERTGTHVYKGRSKTLTVMGG